jgi:hypothetical protein
MKKMHNYGVYFVEKEKKHFWSRPEAVDHVLIDDGFGDPYDADVRREQLEVENPRGEYYVEEVDSDYED